MTMVKPMCEHTETTTIIYDDNIIPKKIICKVYRIATART